MGKLKFVLFSGKGGVGKTTMAASSAIYFALSGKRTLLFSTDPAHSLSDSLIQPIGGKVSPVNGVPNLFALEQDAEALMSVFKEEYGEEISRLLTSCTYLDDNDVREFTDLTIPGLDELMGLQQIIDFMETNEFDIYVWDTAPTGHTLRLLQMPDIIDQWVKLLAQMRWKYRDIMGVLAGKKFSDDAEDLMLNLKKTIKKVSRYFKDPHICRFIAVTIPEFMAVNELDRMQSSLRKLSMPIKHIVVNNVMKEDNGCAYCKIRKQGQKPYLDRIRSSYSKFRVAEVYQRPHEIKGLGNLIDLHHDISSLLQE